MEGFLAIRAFPGPVHAVDRLPLVEQDARARPLEAADPQVSELAAVERDVQRPGPARDPGAVEEVLVPARDLQEELALAAVPVEGKESVAARNVAYAVGDGGSPVRGFHRGFVRSQRRTGLFRSSGAAAAAKRTVTKESMRI
jgi:hypothetical protein